jgi:hypothetical protein
MNLALSILCLWVGSAFLYLASHGLQATTPWAAFQTIITKIDESAG